MKKYQFVVNFTLVNKYDESSHYEGITIVAANNYEAEVEASKMKGKHCEVREFKILMKLEIPEVSEDYSFEESDDPRTTI